MKKILILSTVVMLVASLVVSCDNSVSPSFVSYTVKFMDGEVLVSSQVVPAGGKITKPDVKPTADGYIAEGWYREDVNSEDSEWDFLNDTVSKDITLRAVQSKLKPVGGRIYFIRNDKETRETERKVSYDFYTEDYKPIDDITVEGLKDAKYYTKRERGVVIDKVDLFYVYDNETRNEETTGYPKTVYAEGGLADGKYWGYSITFCGCYKENIGDGKGTAHTIITLLGTPGDISPNIWEYVEACRINKIGGCDDWYIPTKAELLKLKESGFEPDWFETKQIWTSVEGSWASAYFWRYELADRPYNDWDQDGKCDIPEPKCVVAVRSF